MRLVGALSIFFLSLVVIVEGAYIVKLTRTVGALTAEVRASRSVPAVGDETLAAPTPAPAPATARPGPPRLAPPPGPPQEVAILRNALESPEGRQELSSAIDAIREQERRTLVTNRIARDIQRDQRYQQRLVRFAGVSPDEQQQISALFDDLAARRQQTLDELRAGTLDPDDATSTLDSLSRETSSRVRAVLGDRRLKELSDAHLAELRRQRAAAAAP